MTNTTAKQIESLRKLIAMEPFVPTTKFGGIKTGLNSAVLANLRENGFITCTTTYLRGIVTADLQITDKGREVAGVK